MKNITDLKNLLYNDVKEQEAIASEIENLEWKIALYQEVLNILENEDIDYLIDNVMFINLHLSSIYDKTHLELYNINEILYTCKNNIVMQKENPLSKLNKYTKILKSDYELTMDRLAFLKSKLDIKRIKISRKIISSLKYKQVINDKFINFIKDRLEKENYTEKEIILILESIKIHNKKCNNTYGRKLNYEELYSIMNLIKLGYEYIDLPYIADEKLPLIADNMISMLDKNDLKTCESLLDSLDYHSPEELEYIYSKILIHYQNVVYDTIEILKDEDGYYDKEIVEMVKNDYHKAITRYKIVREKLYEIQKTEIMENIKPENSNNLYYSSNSPEPNKAYFVKDITDIREEAYADIKKYMDDFKKGVMTKVKPLAFNQRFIEIKDDQIRIVIKPLGGNNYSVMGAFIKKDDNDRPTYNQMFRRPIALINDEYSGKVEGYWQQYIEENQRKGNR